MATKTDEPTKVRFKIDVPGLAYNREHGIKSGDIVDVFSHAEAQRLIRAEIAEPV